MKRTDKEPDAILTSDWHLREDQPICRVDDFWLAQWIVVDQVAALQKKHNCSVLCAGDLFHHWKPSPYLLSTTKQHLPKRFYTIYGQHDLPQHSLDLKHKSGIYDLEVSKFLTVIESGSWGQKPKKKMIFAEQRKWIGVYHHFVWDGKKLPWPGCEGSTAKDLLKKYSKFDLLVTGDHHRSFVTKYKGRLLVNPGCLTRQYADYADYKPQVYLWYSKTNTVEVVYLKMSSEVVVRDHLEKLEQRNNRIEAFLSRVGEDWEIGTLFEENIDRFISKNKVKKNISKLVYKAMESE